MNTRRGSRRSSGWSDDRRSRSSFLRGSEKRTIVVASGLFTWYVASFGSYDATYGSLGAIFGFMTWLWITAIIVIVGAEPNSEIQHQPGAIPRQEGRVRWASEVR